MAKFKVGDKADVVESNRWIRKVEIRSAADGIYLIRFPETGGGIKVKESSLYVSKEEAEKRLHGNKPKNLISLHGEVGNA